MSLTAFQLPSKIITGLDSIAKGVEYILSFGERVFILTESIIRNTPFYKSFYNQLERSGANILSFDDLESGTSIDVFHNVLLKVKTGRPNCLISVGGTRTHALSRVIAVLANSKVSVERFFAGEQPKEPGLPLVNIATSGRDHFAARSDIALHESFVGRPLIVQTESNPLRATILDPKFCVEIPPKQATLYLFDQLLIIADILASQFSNPISDANAQSASTIAAHALRNMVNNPKDIKNGIEACSAGALTIIAMGACQPGLGFAIQLALASRYGIPKSLSAAIILPFLIELYGAYRSAHFISFAHAMGIDTESTDPERAPVLASQALRRISAKLNLPSRFAELRISPDKASEIAGTVMEVPYIRSAPFAITQTHVLDLIRKAI